MFDLNNCNISVYDMKLLPPEPNEEIKYYVSANFKLCIINSGEGIWDIGNTFYKVKRGDIIILNNRANRAFSEIFSREGIHITVIDFEPEFVIDTQFSVLFLNDEISAKITGNDELIRLFKEIEEEEINKLLNYQTIISTKLINILSLICRMCSISSKDLYPINRDMRTALIYIEQNYTSDISVSDIAKQLHMTPNCFSKQFSKNMKMGFSKYVMQKRVHKAMHLLDTTDKTVLEIAMDCGFNNMTNFYKAFKKITGIVPTIYKKINKKIIY